MLASPLGPAPVFPEDSTQYRPAKDLDAFNSLLPPPIEFIEGSSSGALAIPEGKYQPINGTPKAGKVETHDSKKVPQGSPSKSPKSPVSFVTNRPLHTGPLPTSWPSGATIGSGLNNTGNTCFLNSALQCLLHTTPLLNVLVAHSQKDPCRVKSGFCMACGMRQLMLESFSKHRPFTPYMITTKLQVIAKHMRRGRQEDTHEFLRYAVDALQKSCLTGHPPKLDPKIAETTWVHRIFGGRLRSRVTCLDCGYNSDTFDSILDLSIDIYGVVGLRDALRKFVAIDHLKGADKYKCEKCKKAVTANKQFTVHEAPLVLTIHLKRFSPMGRKIGHPIKYDETLSLQPVMSEGQHGPTYSLYGVISHAGSGPNSGHYYAHVKAANGQWHEMNDETVSRHTGSPTGLKNAYMLFYIRDKGQALEAAVRAPPTSSAATTPALPRKAAGVVASMRKRVEGDEENTGASEAKKPAPFIGPVLPPQPPVPAVAPQTPKPKIDPQAELLKKKISAVSRSPIAALQSLSQYDDDSSSDTGEKVEEAAKDSGLKDMDTDMAPPEPTIPAPPIPAAPAPSSSALEPAPITSSAKVTAPVPVTSFYGSSGKNSASKKRKSPDGDDDGALSEWARTPISPGLHSSSPLRKEGRQSGYTRFTGGNPFNRLTGSNNLQQRRDPAFPKHRYGKKKRLIM